jgi:hypothetical protein
MEVYIINAGEYIYGLVGHAFEIRRRRAKRLVLAVSGRLSLTPSQCLPLQTWDMVFVSS